ncbi:MAG: hypothetical protein NTU81_00305 [Candidatus Nomurabacteria bacterium]|nr:hypothetical protein [Candidatus Nomurabacteria bacterium]
MKYKKQITVGALALSLLVSGSSVFAATPQDLGIKVAQPTQQKHEKEIKSKKDNTIVGVVSNVSSTGFTVDVKNKKTKTPKSFEVKTDTTTVYKKNGVISSVSDVAAGQKVTITGALDKTTSTISAKQVKIFVAGVKKVETKKDLKSLKSN